MLPFAFGSLGSDYHRHVKILLAITKGYIRRAIPGSDRECMEQLAIRRQLQHLASRPLSDVNISAAVDLHAVGS